MTLNEVCIRVKERSHRGDITITTDDTTATIIRCVNDAMREISKRLPKDFQRTSSTVATVSGTTTYALAADTQEPILFTYTTGGADYFLTRIPTEQEFYNKYYSSTLANNKPLYYYEVGADASNYRQIRLWPTPDAAYTITYPYYRFLGATDLTTSNLATEIPYLPKWLHDAVWKVALYEFLKGFDDPYQSRAQADAERALIDIDTADDRDTDGGAGFRFDVQNSALFGPSTGIRIT